MTDVFSIALGVATKNSAGDIIEAFYPAPQLNPSSDLIQLLCEHLEIVLHQNSVMSVAASSAKNLAKALKNANGLVSEAEITLLESNNANLILCVLTEDSNPRTIGEVFLKLHLLSHRLVKPHEINLTGMFGILKNLAWTNRGPLELHDLPSAQLSARLEGKVLNVETVDKFPKMTNYVVPQGIRIADTARVRLGAYIGEGTTVMHEGFVNFNAGTLGAAMIEGRISAGVVVGKDSDLGGGCSTMGTLSGGGTEIISVGERCLIGANGGIGFPLADGCIVEAGLYVTAGTKVNVLDTNGNLETTCKAVSIATKTDRLFRRNSISGAVECVPLKTAVSLNEELHANN